MKNGWTGGQYSVFRAILATYLLMHFVSLLPLGAASPLPRLFPKVFPVWDSPILVTVFHVVGGVLCLFFAIGLYDRAAALGLCGCWLCLFVRDPHFANSSSLFIALLLLAHVFVPPAPYGSWAARGRIDPGGGWRMPPALFAAAWIALALGYLYSGISTMQNAECRMQNENRICLSFCILHSAFCIGFAPLTLLPRLRPGYGA